MGLDRPTEDATDARKGTIQVGTARIREEAVALSGLANERKGRFGTHFTEADRPFLAQRRVTAERCRHASNRLPFAIQRCIDTLHATDPAASIRVRAHRGLADDRHRAPGSARRRL